MLDSGNFKLLDPNSNDFKHSDEHANIILCTLHRTISLNKLIFKLLVSFFLLSCNIKDTLGFKILKKLCCIVEALLLHSGGTVCRADAWSAQWRLGLPSKSGRLVSAQLRLMASRGFLPPQTNGSLFLTLKGVAVYVRQLN